MKKSIQYSIIGGIAAVMFVGGFFAYPMTEPQNNNLSQTLALGGYGVVEAYHADGTLFYEWEGHNTLQSPAKNAISSCLSGIDVTPIGGNHPCTGMIESIQIRGINLFETQTPIQTLLPLGCNSDGDVLGEPVCDGWQVRGTFDFTSLSCTPGNDCPVLNSVRTNISNSPFNLLSVTSQEITPGDIVAVTISFNIS